MLRAEIALAAPDAAPLGEPRVALLEAIGREGSISAAARAVGLSYRAAWDAVCAMNALTGQPLVAGQTGGRGGGGASLTAEGLRLVETYRRLETEVARALRAAAPDLATADGAGASEAARLLLFGGFLRTSARNTLRGTVLAVRQGPVNAEVDLAIGDGQVLAVQLTTRSVRELGLFPGRPATALVKAPLVGIAAAPRPEWPNCIAGMVAAVARDGAGTEVSLAIDGGSTLCAILAPDAAVPDPGASAFAIIDPAHVILAVE